jgi:hypothetical protein
MSEPSQVVLVTGCSTGIGREERDALMHGAYGLDKRAH